MTLTDDTRVVIYSHNIYSYCAFKSLTVEIYNRNDIMIAIYEHNDSGQYYETMILPNLALARSVNYDCKVCCKLKGTLQS